VLARERGISSVEMVLVSPILLIILFSIIEFGIILFDKALITNASREAARSAIALRQTPLTASQLSALSSSVVTNYTTGIIDFQGATPTVTTTTATDPKGYGKFLTVKVAFSYKTLVIGKLFSLIPNKTLQDPVVLSSSMTMYME